MRKLSEDEIKLKAQDLANSIAKLKVLKERANQDKQSWKSRITELEGKIDSLSDEIRLGCEKDEQLTLPGAQQ